MTQYNDELEKADREERRKRTGAAFLDLRQGVEGVCAAVDQAANIADQVDEVISRVGSLIDSTDAREFLSEEDRNRIRNAAEQFRNAKGHLDRIADACDKLTKVLNAAEDVLSRLESASGAGGEDKGSFSRSGRWFTGGVLATVVIVIVILVYLDGDGDQLVWGDLDCDSTVGTRDSQGILRNVLEQNALSQTQPCPVIGSAGDDGLAGDLDCDGTVGTRDSQAILRFALEQNALSRTQPCPLIGSPI